MRALLLVLLLGSFTITFGQVTSGGTDYTALVDPRIDTHKSRWFYFSSASRPFGMVNLSPDTNLKGSWESGYLYDSTVVRGFSHIHGWQISGLLVMPATGEMIGHRGPDAYRSPFRHATEVVRPGYHRLELDRYGITAELTSTTRVGLHRYAFPDDDRARYLYFDTGAFLAHDSTLYSEARRISDREIAGLAVMGPTNRRPKPFTVYFVARVDRDIAAFGGWEAARLVEEPRDSVGGRDAGAYLQFADGTDTVQLKVALSYTSVEGARRNLEAELPGWDFDQVVEDSRAEWNQELAKIHVTGGTKAHQVKFYTDLCHSLLGRRIVSDHDGYYADNTGPETRVRRVGLDEDGRPRFPHYNFDAWWGSHWSLDILWSLAYPERLDGFGSTMQDMYLNGGMIPRGPSGGNYTYVMIGDPATPFFAAAINRGIHRGFDVDTVYAGLRKNAFPGGIRDKAGYEHGTRLGGGMGYYVDRGYVPEGLPGTGYHKDGASMTLEYAYQDWCLAQIARTLGKEDDYGLFMERSQNYRNLWNPASGWMHPREIDGSLIADFAPVAAADQFSARGFCEGNSAIYSHFVPHDIPGLVELFGGREAYLASLTASFERQSQHWLQANDKNHAVNWVDYANQPSTHMAHLFNVAGAPWLSQKWVRTVKERYADITPYGGYHGDEDQGQMGALGVLMAIGLFSVDGSTATEPGYEITTPLFDEVRIALNPTYYPGDSFTIRTEGDPTNNLYIQQARWRSREWNSVTFPHREFARGGVLELTVGPRPDTTWGVASPELPPSPRRDGPGRGAGERTIRAGERIVDNRSATADGAGHPTTIPASMKDMSLLYRFTLNSRDDWEVEDDTVMGGKSKGKFRLTEEGHGQFYGHVSLANDGGFSSIVHELKKVIDVSGYRAFTVRLKGDGSDYTFRIRSSEDQEYFHEATFPTTGEWETVEIPFETMHAVHHGEPVDVPNFAGGPVHDLQFLIGNKEEQDFEVELNNFGYTE
ncbi:CIA30 family protein [Lewinella sp. IMCC34183]|uniref:CIA30 family protein n=1 Tax=Lewinella sp. IMCC34183 TaxID=2248762 RepID=UPI000E2201EA|nr:CIA30 family protein [Lewinella sp. IMCC34183]